MTSQEISQLKEIYNGNPKEIKYHLGVFIGKEENKNGTRTLNQNAAIHLWLTQVAEELDRHGHTLQNVVGKIQRAEIRPTMSNLKESVWKPYQLAAVQKESTTQLNKLEVDKIYEGLNKFFGENFEIHIPFPSRGAENDTLSAHELRKKLEKDGVI